MEELFQLIKAFNRLEEKVVALTSKIDFLAKSPYQQLNQKYLEEDAACKILRISPRTLAKMRQAVQYHT